MSENSSNSEDFISIIGAILLAIFLFVSIGKCHDDSIKARAYEKVRDEKMDPEEALDEAEYEEQQMNDVMEDNVIQ